MKCNSNFLIIVAGLILVSSLVQSSPDTTRVHELIHQARDHYFHAQYDSLLHCSLQALSIAQKADYPAGMAKAYNLTGIAYLAQGTLLAAQHYFDSTRLTYQSMGDSAGLTLALCNLGHVQERYGDYEHALRYFWQEFSVSEAIGDTNKMGMAYQDIGRVQQAQGNYAQALPYYEQALSFFQSQHHPYYVASTLGNLGNLHTAHQSWEKGVTYLKQALKMTDSLDNPDQEAALLNYLAEAYQQRDQFTTAMHYYRQALQLDTARVSPGTRLRSLTGAGATARHLKQPQAAKDWLQEAQAWINQKSSDAHDQLHLEQELSKLYKQTGQYALALEHYETADLLEDSLLNAEKIERLSELQIRYETEKKDREITSLQYQQATQEASLMRRSWQRNLSIILLLGVILVTVLILRYHRLRQRHQQALLAQEQAIHAAKSRFFTDIAHEFRSPLTLIQGPAEQITTHSPDPNCRRHAKLIQKQSGRLLQLVNQILYLSRLESGVILSEPTSQDLIAFLRSMIHAYESMAEQHEINLRFSSTVPRLVTSFDKDQFEKIWTNLLTNACRFTPPGGTISLEVTLPQPHQVTVVVRDTGIGIPDKHLPRIFDRYYTAAGTHLNTTGAGIGLALTKELVERHEGQITVQSKPGEETTFCVVLPVHHPSQPAPTEPIQEVVFSVPSHSAKEIISAPASPDTRQMLLVIDDNPEIRSYLTDTLGKQYAVVEASNGEEGLDLAFQHVPDLVVSDVLMSNMTGYEVCQQLKNDDRTSHIPVILLTGKNSTEAKIAGLEVQADDYLTKPFNSRELLTRIANLIQVRQLLLSRPRTHSDSITPPHMSLPSRERQFIEKLTAAVHEHLSDESFGVNELCQAVGMSRTQLHRKLKALTGESTTTFVRQLRLRHSMQLLQTSDLSVSEIAYQVGFSTPAYFSTRFAESYGYPPSEVRSNQSQVLERK